MTRTKQRSDRSGSARGHSGYRATRGEEVEVQIERRLWALSLGCDLRRAARADPAFMGRIDRALRAERRAARRGGAGYDPLRHLALVRLVRLARRRDPRS